jgi:serine/threonine protein kinase
MKRTIRPEIGTYHMHEFLGEGSMAFVYKAIRVDSRGFSRQPVALKVLKSDIQVQFLIQEMSTLMRVRSPHCVNLLGWENLPQGPAIVMEWVEGTSLENLAKHGPLDAATIHEIASQVQSGLRDLKHAGLCHGDLSPSNILIDVDGHVKLVDFGLSSTQGASQIAGTPQFMSPERWEGQPPSFESDLFSLGVIVHDLEQNQLFKQAPAMIWKTRSAALANEEFGWLSRDPSRRSFQPLDSNEMHKARLGRKVQNIRTESAKMARTFALELQRRDTRLMKVALMVFFAIFCFPIAPFGQSSRLALIPSASLEVRTLNWVHVQLGLFDLGYAPFSRKGLPAGLHRIQWKTKTKSGSKIISLGYGEKKILTDQDFK